MPHSAVWRDARLALRSWTAQPALIGAAIVSLALGIGANTALFSVAYAVLLRPLPYAHAERLAILWNRSPGLNITEDWFSTAQYFDIKQAGGSFDDVAIAIGANANLTGDGRPERIGTIRASSNLLPLLGANAVLGRLFTADEDAPGAAPVVVLSHGLWQRRFGSDPNVLGRVLTINGLSHHTIGVLPEWFSLPRDVLPTLGVVEDGDVFLPLPLGPDAAGIRTREDYNVVARLKPGVSVDAAQAEMDALTVRLRQLYPALYPPNGGLTFSVVPLHDEVAGDVRPALLLLLAGVGIVLAVACGNVANLLLARALARARDTAIRVALGATMGRIARQLLSESVVLALLGGLAGLAVAAGGVAWVRAVRPAGLPRVDEVSLSLPVFAFALALSVVAGLVFGLAPLAGARRLNLSAHLSSAGRGASAGGAVWRSGFSLRGALVVTELALSIMLLTGAGLLVRSFLSLAREPAGFETMGILSFEVSLTGPKYPDGPAVAEGYTRLWSALSSLPGVDGVGGVTTLPLTDRMAWGPITAEGVPPPPGEQFYNADQRTATSTYFDTMRIPVVRGRPFDARDRRGGDRVVIVDARLAEALWPGQDPVGRRLHFGDANATSPWETIVGVVDRVKHYGLDVDPRMTVYRPHTQSVARSLFVVVRTGGDLDRLRSAVAEAVRTVDSDLPISNVRSMPERLGDSLARRRFAMTLLTIFAIVATALAAVGTYGVMAYLVSQNRRELGIRLALGATRRRVIALVVGRGALVAGVGVAIGLVGAFLVTRLMRGLLFGVGATDPAAFGVAAASVGLTAIVACVIPAWRAARVDPIGVLKGD